MGLSCIGSSEGDGEGIAAGEVGTNDIGLGTVTAGGDLRALSPRLSLSLLSNLMAKETSSSSEVVSSQAANSS